jgi:uncharacterized membrane protein
MTRGMLLKFRIPLMMNFLTMVKVRYLGLGLVVGLGLGG